MIRSCDFVNYAICVFGKKGGACRWPGPVAGAHDPGHGAGAERLAGPGPEERGGWARKNPPQSFSERRKTIPRDMPAGAISKSLAPRREHVSVWRGAAGAPPVAVRERIRRADSPSLPVNSSGLRDPGRCREPRRRALRRLHTGSRGTQRSTACWTFRWAPSSPRHVAVATSIGRRSRSCRRGRGRVSDLRCINHIEDGLTTLNHKYLRQRRGTPSGCGRAPEMAQDGGAGGLPASAAGLAGSVVAAGLRSAGKGPEVLPRCRHVEVALQSCVGE